MTARMADYAIVAYEDNIKVFTEDPTPIPLAIPMSRRAIITLLHRAQVAEVRDPDVLDTGEE